MVGTWRGDGWRWWQWLCHIVGMGGGNRPQECRPGHADRHHHPAAGDHRTSGETGCPVGRASQARGSGRMPGLKPKGDRKPDQPKKPRKRRPHGFARSRMVPTQRWSTPWTIVPTAEPSCRGLDPAHSRSDRCAGGAGGGYRARLYGSHLSGCRRRCVPPAQLEGVVMGKQRLGVNLTGLIATLRGGGSVAPLA